MRQIHLLILAFVLCIQPVFADDTMMSSDSKPCAAIAKACLNAGYSRNENEGKKFWVDCMKPTILGKNVKGVNVDSSTVKSCLMDKVNQLKQELTDFENASTK